jgi:DNA-binding transcriptional LysR family regulator
MQKRRRRHGVDLLQHMATFVRIADAGSISKGARSRNLSVAMASRHLRALEDELGVALMRRTTHQLDLTEAGAEFLARARAVLASADEAKDAVRPDRGAVGLVVVSLPVSFGLSMIEPLFHQLLRDHARLRLDLRFEDRAVDLLGDGVDLAIRAGVALPDSPFLVARRLATVRRVLCASPAFLAQSSSIASVADLARVPCVVQGPAPTRWHFASADPPGGMDAVVVDGRFRTNNVIAIRNAVLQGEGVGRLPLWVVKEDLRAKRLVQVLPSAELTRVDIFGVVHRGSSTSAVRAVLERVQAELPARLEGES